MTRMEGAMLLSAAHDSVEGCEKPLAVPQNAKHAVNAATRLFTKSFLGTILVTETEDVEKTINGK